MGTFDIIENQTHAISDPETISFLPIDVFSVPLRVPWASSPRHKGPESWLPSETSTHGRGVQRHLGTLFHNKHSLPGESFGLDLASGHIQVLCVQNG